jgi:hypothetical protein
VDSFAGRAGNYASYVNEANALFCGQCGRQIPPDSIFCPMCGSHAGAPGSVTPSHLHGHAQPPRRTPVQPQQAQPDVQPDAWAAPAPRRQSSTGPSPLRIALGALSLVAAVLVAIWFLGGAGSMSSAGDVATSMSAAALALVGIALMVSGALRRAEGPVRCRRCGVPVEAWKGAFGLHCPHGPHHARIHWFLVGLTALFWVGFVAAAVVLLVWL